MYEKYWGLEYPPFEECHAVTSFVESQDLKLARAKLRHVLAHGQGAAAVVGPAGIGKTAMARQLLNEFEAEGWATSFISAPVGKPQDILLAIAYDLGGCGENPLEALRDAALLLEAEGRRACIMIDEAHTITRLDLLEDLRMLLNLEFSNQARLSLLLVGQESLPELLAAASGFDQRLALIVRLQPMGTETCKRYILTRLKQAGCKRGLFSKSAADSIEKLSLGVPRNINRLCELSLTVGYGFGLEKISREVVNNVARDLGLFREEKPRPRRLNVTEASEQQLERDIALALHAGKSGEDLLAQDELYQMPPEGLQLISPDEIIPIGPGSAADNAGLVPPDVDDGTGLFSSLARTSGQPAIRTPEGDVLSSAAIMEESFMPPPPDAKEIAEASRAKLIASAPEKIFPHDGRLKSETDILASTGEEETDDILSATLKEAVPGAQEQPAAPSPPLVDNDDDDEEDILAEL